MTKAEQKLHADAEKLRVKLAEAEAVVDTIKAKLNRIDRKLTGEPSRETGLDMLWNAAPPMARTRASKFRCRKAWNCIPESERPKISDMLHAIRAWSRCWDWKKDGGMYVPGLDKWIKDRRWESLPEDTAGSAARKFEAAPKTTPEPDPDAPLNMDDLPATAADIAAAFAPLKSLYQSTRVNS
jgi:hypothetical protein